MTDLRRRRPFWYSPINYYAIFFGTILCLFFPFWGLLHDAGDDTPWISAGVAAIVLLAGAVFLREGILKRSAHAVQRSIPPLRSSGGHVSAGHGPNRNNDKLTIERNAELIADITRKSDAADVLGSFSAVHREIFDLCDAYLTKNEIELRHIGIGSPRLVPLRKGREMVARYHRYHLLRWAEIETGNLNRRAMEAPAPSEKIEAAQTALGLIEFAIAYYPDERALVESRLALNEIMISIEVSALVEEAEREAFRGNAREAKRNYRDALFLLGRDNIHNESRQMAAERIIVEIKKLDRAEDGMDWSSATADRT